MLTHFAFGGEPIWSPNGDQALMLLPTSKNSSRQVLYLLDTAGKIEKLTQFGIVGPYSWSPDSNFVAFWLANGKEIGILDINAKEISVFCVNSKYKTYVDDPTEYEIPTGGKLVWLPNNKQILVEVTIHIDETRYEGVVIADIEKNLFLDLKWNAISPIWVDE
jgi:Tol biopolymer transport system component